MRIAPFVTTTHNFEKKQETENSIDSLLDAYNKKQAAKKKR